METCTSHEADKHFLLRARPCTRKMETCTSHEADKHFLLRARLCT